MFQSWSGNVRVLNTLDVLTYNSDRNVVRLTVPHCDAGQSKIIPWALEMKAVCTEEPCRLVRTLTGAILGCGGWILSRGSTDTGVVNMLFEFERQACVEIYSTLIACGLELSQSGHVRFTELCQCTRSHQRDCSLEVASIDLEIQTLPADQSTRVHFTAAT